MWMQMFSFPYTAWPDGLQCLVTFLDVIFVTNDTCYVLFFKFLRLFE